jgi:hypothetical protein
VTIADRKMTRCTGMAWRRKNIFRKIWTQGNGGLRSKLTAAGMRNGPECKNGMSDWGLRQHLRKKSE